jgi:hypothetical protein
MRSDGAGDFKSREHLWVLKFRYYLRSLDFLDLPI